jgi:hypothetical protein
VMSPTTASGRLFKRETAVWIDETVQAESPGTWQGESMVWHRHTGAGSTVPDIMMEETKLSDPPGNGWSHCCNLLFI